MTEREVLVLINNDCISTAQIIPADDAWHLVCIQKSMNSPLIISDDSGQYMAFRTIDMAVKICKRLGFKNVDVHISD